MKRIALISFILISIITKSYSQQLTPAFLTSTWDQTTGSHPATIIFVDNSRVEYSYKGHTGKTQDFYYLLNTSNTPAILTVDFKENHKKHRNEYLIEVINKDTIKLQVLYKKDSRDHFSEEHKDQIVILARRKAL
jgi:hypothetical protein